MFRQFFIVVVILLFGIANVRAAVSSPDPKLWITAPYDGYADAAYEVYIRHLYDPSQFRLLLAADSKKPSNYWNAAVAFQTLLHYANFIRPRRPVVANEIAVIVGRLVITQKTLGESDAQLRNNYNDDMSWMIHGLTALYDHTGNMTYIDMATLLFDTVRQSDNTTCCGDMKGGVWWDLFHTQKATAAQAGVTMAALRLMETGAVTKHSQSFLLQYAIDHYAFWRQHMVNNETGQVCDSINTKGVRNWWSFTYNNGLMLGAAVHLYNATLYKTYLIDAQLFASFLMKGQTVSINGTQRVIMINDCDGCSNDGSEFHQVSFQYLTEYYRLLFQLQQGQRGFGRELSYKLSAPLGELYTFLQANIDSLWVNARNNESGLFNCNWDAPFNKGDDGLQGTMNAAMSAFSLFTTLPLPPSVGVRNK